MDLPIANAAGSPMARGIPDERQYLAFNLGDALFALPILDVKEIIGRHTLTRVPGMPDEVRGVMDLRGTLVPVIDLSARFWRCRVEPGGRACVVIVELEDGAARQTAGLLVDGVHKAVEISPADIEAAPDLGAGIRKDFIVGLGRLDDRFVVILDVNRLLAQDGASGPYENTAPGIHGTLSSMGGAPMG